jgi:hypothetical protein
MAKRIRIKQTLNDALSIKAAWEKIPDFKVGTVSLNDFIAASAAAETGHKDHAAKGADLADAKAERDQKIRQVDDLITRFKSGVRALYGPDSVQYEQAGGTRSSLRKSPARKSQAVPTASAPAEAKSPASTAAAAHA